MGYTVSPALFSHRSRVPAKRPSLFSEREVGHTSTFPSMTGSQLLPHQGRGMQGAITPQPGPPTAVQFGRDPPWPGTPGSTDRLAYSGHTDDRVKIKTLCSVPSLLGWLTAVIRTSSLEEWEVGKRINSRKQTHQDESGGWTCVVWCGQGGTLENRNKGARLDDLCASMQKPR